MVPRKASGQSDRREAVLRAAIGVFAEHGFQGATIEEIARRAEVAKGTPYLYFKDKSDLFYAVFERWAMEAMTASEAALAAASGAQAKLLALALSAAEFMDTHRAWFPLTLEVWAASSTPALRERFSAALQSLYAGWRAHTAAIVREGQASGEFGPDVDAEGLAALLTGAVDGLFLQCWFDPTLDAKALIRGFFDALLQGIAHRPGAKQ